MSPGKISAQTGHAYVDAFDQAKQKYPDRADKWKNGYHGIKVTLQVDNLEELLEVERKAKEAGVNTALVVDLGYTCFDGQSTITVLGIGPATKDEVKNITGKLKLLK